MASAPTLFEAVVGRGLPVMPAVIAAVVIPLGAVTNPRSDGEPTMIEAGLLGLGPG